MGSQESKRLQPPTVDDTVAKEINGSIPSSPMLTPLDPRSPTVNIARTPLDLILEDKTNGEVDGAVEKKHYTNVVLAIDPRSPTTEFVRTPIVVKTGGDEKCIKLINKNLDKVRQSAFQTTPVTRGKESTQIPPKLLSSSPVAVAPHHKRKSFVGLLETNVDFTETNLDTVCQARDDLNMSLPLDVQVQPDVIPLNKLKSQMETLQLDANNEETDKSISIIAHVKDFDKKLTNLIYEDENSDGESKKPNLKVTICNVKVRTPLALKNANESQKHRLRVSDKPRKSHGSKIPVFKSINGSADIQCENTPPTKLQAAKMRTKISNWDADKTLII